MDLEFEKYSKVNQRLHSPRTVLPSPQHHAKYEKSSKKKSKSSSKHNQLILEAGFKEIKFRNHHRSVSCQALPTRNIELAVDSDVLNRGSIYQSSKERKSFKRADSVNGRKKIEFSVSGDASFSFSLLDSICGSDEEESSLQLDDRNCSSLRPAERDLMANPKFKSTEMVGHLSNANILKEDGNQALQESLSAKLALPHSPMNSDSDGSNGSLGSRFTPIREILDPLTKPNSHQSFGKLDDGVIRASGPRNKTLRKSLFHDFSSAMPHTESIPPCSPAHLHGDLKFEQKHGMPYFELSLAHSDNVLVANTCKIDDALNWVYTFHSFPGRKKYSNKDSSIVGQMQVSTHLSLETKEGGELANSMTTEFVLHDIMNARKGLATKEQGLVPDVVQDLHPIHEIAAIVIKVPFEKRESLKHRSDDAFGSEVHPNLLDLSLAEQTPKGSTTMVNVVTPSGNHSLPTCDDSRGPSPLLDRWRQGGCCDCGGWDMACPLIVFDNLRSWCKETQNSLLLNNQPLDLYLQGAKEKTPALTMKFTRRGHYSIDFHAQLSALQALAICVAIMHASELSSTQEMQKQILQCSSKEALVGDEVVSGGKVMKDNEEHTHCFVLDPPFSPIARV